MRHFLADMRMVLHGEIIKLMNLKISQNVKGFLIQILLLRHFIGKILNLSLAM